MELTIEKKLSLIEQSKVLFLTDETVITLIELSIPELEKKEEYETCAYLLKKKVSLEEKVKSKTSNLQKLVKEQFEEMVKDFKKESE